VYEARGTAAQVLTEHFPTEQHAVRVEVDEAQPHRAVVALRAMAPNALRLIDELLPILCPGVRLSYRTIQSMLVCAEAKAREFNSRVDMSGVRAGALDEMFSQGDSVLAEVDLDSGYLFALELLAAWASLKDRLGAQAEDVLDAVKGVLGYPPSGTIH
jgi:hypothetical protein